MPIAKVEPVYAYVALVSSFGLGLLTYLIADAGFGSIVESFGPAVWIFSALIVLTELRPLQVPRGDQELSVTTSIAFSFAVLLTAGTAAAALVLAVAALISEAVDRRAWWKALFNVAQYTIAMAAGGGIVNGLTDLEGGGSADFGVGNIPAVLLAGLVFIVVNAVLTGVAVAVVQNLPVLGFFRQDLAFQAASSMVLMAAAPVLVVVAEHSLALLPLMAFPVLIAYRTAAVSVEKEHQAMHDALTGLPNRSALYEHLGRSLRAVASGGPPPALLIVDLDRFREINDALGHGTGDNLLRQVGPRLRRVLGERDAVTRLGGDEFGVVLHDGADRWMVEAVAAGINAALEQPFLIDGLRLEVGASIGIALRHDAAVDVETLVRRADVAMYVAKSQQTGRAVYGPEHERDTLDRLALVGDLRRAVTSQQLVLHYQPKVDLQTGRVAGAEALVRWEHPDRGLLRPDLFIPLAEHTGLVAPLTMVVLDDALQQCRVWHDAGFPITVAVNLSARALHGESLPRDVSAALEMWGLEARWLTLELTESVIMSDQVRSADVLRELNDLGVRLSIDDFGTGYSSLAYLKRLPVGEIKIDKSFISDLVDDESDAVIARSTIDLGRNLGMRVVAEGVESSEVLDRLREMGCDVVQGYLLSRPVPSNELLAWLADYRGTGQGAAAAAVAAVRGGGTLDITGLEPAPRPTERRPGR